MKKIKLSLLIIISCLFVFSCSKKETEEMSDLDKINNFLILIGLIPLGILIFYSFKFLKARSAAPMQLRGYYSGSNKG